MKLHGDFCALRMADVGKLAQPGDEAVFPDAEAIGRSRTEGMDFRNLRDDQTCAGLGPPFQIGQVRLADRAVFIAQGRSHGRHDETVGKFHRSDTNG